MGTRKRVAEEVVSDHENTGEVKIGKRKRKSVVDDKSEGKNAKHCSEDSKKKIRLKLSTEDNEMKVVPVKSDNNANVEKPRSKKLSVFMNISYWKKRREALSGHFAEAKTNFTEHGPWKLSDQVLADSFGEVAEMTLEKMARYDHFPLELLLFTYGSTH
jgi:hypothetical protein